MQENPRLKPAWKGCISNRWASCGDFSIPLSRTPSKHLRSIQVRDTGRKVSIVLESSFFGIGDISDSFHDLGVHPVLATMLNSIDKQEIKQEGAGSNARSSRTWTPSRPHDFVVGYLVMNLAIALS